MVSAELINKTYKKMTRLEKEDIRPLLYKWGNGYMLNEYMEMFEEIGKIYHKKQLTLTDVVGQSEQLRFLIDKFQTPKGNYLIDLLMEHKEIKQLLISGFSNWVMCKDKLPLDHENYLVEGDGQYAVTFYSVRRKKWHVDFKVTKYKDIPK